MCRWQTLIDGQTLFASWKSDIVYNEYLDMFFPKTNYLLNEEKKIKCWPVHEELEANKSAVGH